MVFHGSKLTYIIIFLKTEDFHLDVITKHFTLQVCNKISYKRLIENPTSYIKLIIEDIKSCIATSTQIMPC